MVDSTPKPDDLTRRQRDILKAVRKLTTDHGHPPSLREVAEAVGINSTGSLHYQYRELQKKGYLRYLNNNPRSVQVRLPGELTFPADTEKPAPLNAINATRLIVPGITNDAVEGHPDKLGVDADARALAALVASRRLQPPLAIGLCGEWGSGKTFFMKRVESSIKELTASGDTDSFCSRVEPVWFSAWHYAEGNLWASLLQHIFRTLNGVKSGRQVTRDEVMGKVRSARQVTLAAAEKVEAARARREAVREAIVAAEEHHEKAIQEAGKLRIKDLWDAVKLSADDLDVKLVVQAANDLGFSVAADSAEDLARATRQVVNLASQSRILATSGPWYRSPLAYAIYAALIVGSLGLLIGETVHATHEWLGTAITAIAQLAAVGSALAGWFIRQGTLARTLIAPAESLQRRLDERFAEQQARNDREIAALEQQADAAKMELTIAMRQRTAADVRLANAEKEQAELTGEHLLQRYLTERAASGDYERYMGVVALAHRDLRDLEEYLRASIDENDNAAEKQAGQLDRIVLYIDDLDRCDPDVVADVLDAIHLLLALPLFVVIVGVDPRWLRQSLHKRHPVLLGSAPSDVTWTSAADYLEKIFQLTYSLPRMNANGCANLLTAAAREAQEVSVSKDQRLGGAYLDGGPEKGIGDYEENSGQSSQALGEDLAEALSLHEKDIEALRDVAPLVSISPRRAKRFLNTYLVVRARALGDPALREYFNYGKDVSGPPLDNTLLALLALLLGLPKTMEMSIHDEHSSDSSQSCTLGAWLTETTPATPEEKARLQEFFSLESPIETLPIGAIMQWLPLVYPYLPIGFEGIYH